MRNRRRASPERIKSDNTIQVTGSAKRRIRSDLIVWRAHVEVSGADLKSRQSFVDGGVGRSTDVVASTVAL